jgi:hypothetical protein
MIFSIQARLSLWIHKWIGGRNYDPQVSQGPKNCGGGAQRGLEKWVSWWEKSSKNGYFCPKMRFFKPKISFLVIFCSKFGQKCHFLVDRPSSVRGGGSKDKIFFRGGAARRSFTTPYSSMPEYSTVKRGDLPLDYCFHHTYPVGGGHCSGRVDDFYDVFRLLGWKWNFFKITLVPRYDFFSKIWKFSMGGWWEGNRPPSHLICMVSTLWCCV